MRLDVRPLQIAAVLEAALDSVRPAAAAKGVHLETVVDAHAGAMMGDPGRIQQVAWNLLMNAVKFTPRGGRVDVHLRRAAAQVELEVRDTGEGISPEHLSRIFQRFGQADSSSTRRHSGLGIGLALVRHLVDLHGGTVSVLSAGPGRGATFTVILPVAAMPALPAPAASGSVRPPGPDRVKPISLRDLRLLVVDDDPDGLELAALVLINAGAEVRTASSPAAAMAVLEDWPADVLVTDLEMPGEDGAGLLRRARQMMTLRARRLPALALTAYGRSEDRVRALAAGFNLHLGKPVDPAELVLAVASLLGRTE
jgi:CheY-like chemotaxis protein